jgi:putative flippase GtrA
MHTALLHLTTFLPRGARRHLTDLRLRLLVQFIQFGTVGLAGLVIDTATVYGLRGWIGIYGAGLVAYGTGATTTWLLNRLWTFRGQGSGPAHHQWARFVLANLGGFVLNRGTYAILVTFWPLAAQQPVIATSAGAIAGMFLNFHLSRRLVFR